MALNTSFQGGQRRAAAGCSWRGSAARADGVRSGQRGQGSERGGGRVLSLHLHDNDGASDQHLLPGGGGIDFAGITAFLAAGGFDGILTMEVGPEPGTDHQDLAALARQAKRAALVASGFSATVFKGD